MISGNTLWSAGCAREVVHTGGKHTIEQLVNQDKIVLNCLLVELAKVAATELDQAVQKLKYQGSISITLSDGDEVNVFVLDMAEGGAAERENRRSNLGVADDLNAKHVGEPRSAIVSERPKNQVLALLVKD